MRAVLLTAPNRGLTIEQLARMTRGGSGLPAMLVIKQRSDVLAEAANVDGVQRSEHPLRNCACGIQ